MHFQVTRESKSYAPSRGYWYPDALIRKSAFARAGLTCSRLDDWLTLTPDEFRLEQELFAIGPLHAADDLPTLLEKLEQLGLVYFDDFFELSGNWPEWLRLYASSEDKAQNL